MDLGPPKCAIEEWRIYNKLAVYRLYLTAS